MTYSVRQRAIEVHYYYVFIISVQAKPIQKFILRSKSELPMRSKSELPNWNFKVKPKLRTWWGCEVLENLQQNPN